MAITLRRQFILLLCTLIILSFSIAATHAAVLSDNGNGTVTDSRTGLIWQQGEPGTMTWDNAISYCEGLTLGGADDWRLPNIRELGSLTDNWAPIDTTYFPNRRSNNYLSSTSFAPDPSFAWHMNYGFSRMIGGKYENYYNVRCVRGGKSGPLTALTISKEGTGNGTVSSNPAGISCGATCSANYPDGQQVFLTAAADRLSALASWTGCDSTDADNKCTVTLSVAKSVTATFLMLPNYTVTYNANGGSGTMTDASSPYLEGDTVTVKTNTFTRSGYTFAGWYPNADGSGTAYGTSFTMGSADTTLYAKWAINGSCGSSNGSPFTVAPTSNLCATGTASAVSGTWSSWSWTCTVDAATSCWAYRPGTVPIPKTGQTKCYSTRGGEIPCAGTGQDGDKLAGIVQSDLIFTDNGTTITDKVYGMTWEKDAGANGASIKTGVVGVPATRFINNGDGTQTDSLTGLVWLKDASCFAPQSWSTALNSANSLKGDGSQCSLTDGSLAGDWRMPNINELASLITNYTDTPANWLTSQGFNGNFDTYYWSSTTGSLQLTPWVIDLQSSDLGRLGRRYCGIYGYPCYWSADESHNVWPVRSGQPGSLTLDTTPPVVSAGANQTKRTQFTQTATATDANPMTYIWSKQSGPGAITFGTSTALSTTISADTDGTYVLRFTATDSANNSAYGEMTLTWDTAVPTTTTSTPGGSFVSAQSITLTCNDETGSGCANIYYTTNGDPPTTSSTVYSGAVSITATTALKYFSVDNAGNQEAPKTETYNLYVCSGTGGTFTATGNMSVARDLQTATTLSDGSILIVGGKDGSNVYASAEIYNPQTGLFTPTGSLNMARSDHTANLLPNGKVLIVGGVLGGSNVQTNTAELYDPATGQFTITGSMTLAKNGHTATLLNNGKVLIAGGNGSGNWAPVYNNAELYDPAAGIFTATAESMVSPRSAHTATLLANGKVLLVAGANAAGSVTNSAELFDPTTGTFSVTGSLNGMRWLHKASRITNGNVLITGGITTGSNYEFSKTAELYDPTTGTFITTAEMSFPRASHASIPQYDGNVLVIGGQNATGISLSSIELYNPASGLFSTPASMTVGRERANAITLQNGKVLVIGGYSSSVGGALSSAEIYTPDACTFVTINTKPTNPTASTLANFTFSSTVQGSIYQCKLDSGNWETCASPKNYTGLADGSHTFNVQAKLGSDLVGVPTTYTWTVDTVGPVGGGFAALPKTGQAKCYDTGGVELTSCAGTGQDGEIQAGVTWPNPRFVDNGDQTVTDKLTGLIWSKDANPANASQSNWDEALAYVKTLNSSNYLGFRDWRLPNKNELLSLIDVSQKYPAISTGHLFSNIIDGGYVTSTTNKWRSNNTLVWGVNMGTGQLDIGGGGVVWPVRSGQMGIVPVYKTGQSFCYNSAGNQISCAGTGHDGELQAGMPLPVPRFTNNPDGTVTDNSTELIWPRDAGIATYANLQAARDNINNLNASNYLGHNDWRMPNKNELESLIDNTRWSPALPDWGNGFFTSVRNFPYWTSTFNVYYGTPWVVDMIYGFDAGEFWTYNSLWPVRGGIFGQIGTAIMINFNSTTTKTASVNLKLSATDPSGVAKMMISNLSNFSGATEENYATSKAWTLSSGDGTKTVYVKFKDSVGNWSQVYSASITVLNAPTAATGAASSINSTGATLNGTITANGAATTVTFDYGTTASYGKSATASQSPLSSSASGSTVSAAITGLTCNTTYHYRVVGQNSAGTTNGSDATFTTSACPQTITFGALTTVSLANSPLTLTATATSGLAVSFSSSDTSIATVSGNTLTLLKGGTVYITASQGGNAAWLAAPNIIRVLTVTAFSKPNLTVSTLAVGSVTKAGILNISGTATSASGSTTVTINGAPVTLESDNSFSAAYQLTPGSNNITTVATDSNGQSTSDSRTITLNLTAPELSITSPADNSSVAGSLLTVTGSVTDPNATVIVALNNGAAQSASRNGLNFSSDLNLREGLNTIQVTATDLTPATSSLARTVTWNRQGPSLAITSPAADISTDQANITLTGAVADALSDITVTITCNGHTYTHNVTAPSGSFSQALTFATAGTYPVTVTAVDTNGNHSISHRTIIYHPQPMITVTSNPAGRSVVVDGITVTTPQNYTWSAGSSHTIAVVTPTQTGSSGTRYQFGSWSDAGAASHVITTPATSATYTAGFATEYQITTGVSPAGTGTVSPATGSWYAAGTVVPVKAFPNTGYGFISWAGPVTDSTSATTSVTMTTPRSITATLGSNPVLTPMITAKSGTTPRTWNINLGNSGQTTASSARITGLALTMTAGTACTPVISAAQFPVVLGDIAVGGFATGGVTIDFNTCAAANRYTATISYSSNGGAVSGSKSYANQFK